MILPQNLQYFDVSVAICAAVSFLGWLTFRLKTRKKNGINGRIDDYRNHFGGKIVLLTGASSGLGKALAELLFESGAELILASRDVKALRQLADQLIKRDYFDDSGTVRKEPECFHLDLADSKSIDEFCDQILVKYDGSIHFIINNAGASMRGESLSTDINVHRRLMDVNYFGHVQLTQRLLTRILASRNDDVFPIDRRPIDIDANEPEKWVVCISSVQGRIALPFRSAYGASKHALQAYFDSLKGELAAMNRHDVKILTVCPGYIKTNLSVNALTADGHSYGKMDETQMNGLEPDDAARKILDAIIGGKTELILADVKTRLALLLRCLMPGLYFWLVVRRARKQMKL